MSATNRVSVCLVSLFLLSAITLAAQEPVIETPDFDSPAAAPAIPVADGDGPTGTAPVLSVFSVVKFSGRILNSDGTPRTGVIGLTFAFYPDQADAAPLWMETQNVSLDDDGRYTVLLGSQSSEGLPLGIFSADGARWLGVQDSSGTEQPRILLVTVPYAMKAAEAESLGGHSADEFVLNEDLTSEVQAQITKEIDSDEGLQLDPGTRGNPMFGVGTPGHIAKFVKTDVIGNSVIFEDPATGNVGIGTDSPDSKLAVGGDFSVSTVGGGLRVIGKNTSPNVLAGSSLNRIAAIAEGATIGGGGGKVLGDSDPANAVTWHFGTVAGGAGNTAGRYSSVGGGSGNFAGGTAVVVAGGRENAARGTASVVAGGEGNTALNHGFIGGGKDNVAESFGVVGGGRVNVAQNSGTVGGGIGNLADGAWAVVGGGDTNRSRGFYSTIGGGLFNLIQSNGTGSVIAGGEDNHAQGSYSSILGGQLNFAGGTLSTVAGGGGNLAVGHGAFAAGVSAHAVHEGAFVWNDTIGERRSTKPHEFTAQATGGFRFIDDVAGSANVVGGVFIDTANGKIISGMADGVEQFSVANDGTVTATKFVGDGSMLTGIGGAGGGGDAGTLDGLDSTEFARLQGGNAFTGNQVITGDVSVASGGGGFHMTGTSVSANVLAGSLANTIAPGLEGATISGGGGGNPETDANRVSGSWGTVSGGQGNTSAGHAAVAGGTLNQAAGRFSFVGGGGQNIASGLSSVVAGGAVNQATAGSSGIGSGQENRARGQASYIGGGLNNHTWPEGPFGFIGSGEMNNVQGSHAAILGGHFNSARGVHSVVAGGLQNEAGGQGSFAAGTHAWALADGTFVWQGDPLASEFTSTRPGEFSAHAPGGFRFVDGRDIAGQVSGGVFIDTDSGKILSGMADGAEQFSVTNDGTVTASAFVGDGSGLTNIPSRAPANTVTFHANLSRLAFFERSELQTPVSNRLGLRLPQGVLIEKIRVCGRDSDAATGNLGVRLRRKALRGGNILDETVVVASGESGASFAEDANRCFDFPANETVDNLNFLYFLEYDIAGPAQISVAQLDYQ